jgi:hypothetical protein
MRNDETMTFLFFSIKFLQVFDKILRIQSRRVIRNYGSGSKFDYGSSGSAARFQAKQMTGVKCWNRIAGVVKTKEVYVRRSHVVLCLSEDSEPTFSMLGNMTIKLRVAVEAFATNLTTKLFLHLAVQAGISCWLFMMDNRCGERTRGRQHHV